MRAENPHKSRIIHPKWLKIPNDSSLKLTEIPKYLSKMAINPWTIHKIDRKSQRIHPYRPKSQKSIPNNPKSLNHPSKMTKTPKNPSWITKHPWTIHPKWPKIPEQSLKMTKTPKKYPSKIPKNPWTIHPKWPNPQSNWSHKNPWPELILERNWCLSGIDPWQAEES